MSNSHKMMNMRPELFSNLDIVFFVIVLLKQTSNFIDANKYQDLSYLTQSSYGYENLRYIRQTNQECQIPSNSSHTKYYNINDKSKITYLPGDYVKNYNVVEVSCDNEYGINPLVQNLSICINGKWKPPLANCLRTCPSLRSIISTNVNCKRSDPDGNDISLRNCINPVEGTRVFLSCNSFYEEASITKNPIRVCNGGKWDSGIPACYPLCGLKRPKANTNIINGPNTEVGDYPWQVGVYNKKKELICGGSMIDYRIVLSAAHCFTDYDGNVEPTENYFITAGKYYRQYNDDRDQFAQYSKVLEIHVPQRYKGLINLQGFDIAVIILADPLKISLRVQPICIELSNESQDLHLSSNKIGIVTGWGFTQNGRHLSEVLKEVKIPYIPYDDCFAAVPHHFRRYITHDKICGGYINNDTSVCGGDSGGGLIFQKVFSDQYYIKGIVSVSPSTEEGVCDSNQYSVFTSVNHHINFVRNLYSYNYLRQSIECAQDECLNKEFINSRTVLSTSSPSSVLPTESSVLLTSSPIYQHYLLPTSDKCGLVTTSDEIYNGKETEIKKIPWAAMLAYSTDNNDSSLVFECGGSLINERYVLTAAYCINRHWLPLKSVRLGQHNTAISRDCQGICNPIAMDYEIESTVVHPDYPGKYRVNDIALIRLKNVVKFNEYIQPICLSLESTLQIVGTNVTVAGFKDAEKGNPSQVILVVVKSVVIPHDQCTASFVNDLITNNQYCALKICENNKCADKCRGVLGDASVRVIKQPAGLQWIQEGIITYPSTICNWRSPVVHTRVSKYAKWIVDNMRE